MQTTANKQVAPNPARVEIEATPAAALRPLMRSISAEYYYVTGRGQAGLAIWSGHHWTISSLTGPIQPQLRLNVQRELDATPSPHLLRVRPGITEFAVMEMLAERGFEPKLEPAPPPLIDRLEGLGVVAIPESLPRITAQTMADAVLYATDLMQEKLQLKALIKHNHRAVLELIEARGYAMTGSEDLETFIRLRHRLVGAWQKINVLIDRHGIILPF